MTVRLAQSLLWIGAATALVVGLVPRDRAAAPASVDAPSYVGVTRPSRAVEIGCGRSGRIARLHVEPGDRVEPGQIVFELESEVERLEVHRTELRAAAHAQLELAQAGLRRAEAEYARVVDLVEQRIRSDADRVEAECGLAIARAEVARAEEFEAQAEIEAQQARARLELLRGRSPIDGVVEKQHHDVGESVDALEPVLDLVALSPLHVEFPCPVADLDRWRLGALAEVRAADGSGEARTAIVVFRGRSTEIASQTVTVRLEVANTDGGWLAGRKVRIAGLGEGVDPAPGPQGR
jgi:RND family efflux transporter MFP subunit